MAARPERGTQVGAWPGSMLPWLGDDTLVSVTVAKLIVQALARRDAISAVTRSYGLDRRRSVRGPVAGGVGHVFHAQRLLPRYESRAAGGG